MKRQIVMPALLAALLTPLVGCSEKPAEESEAPSAINAALEDAKAKSQEVAATVKQQGAEVVAQAKSASTELSAEVKSAAAEVVDSASAQVDQAVATVKDGAAQLGEQASGAVSEVVDEASAGANQLLDSAKAATGLDGKALASSKGCVACHATTDAKMIGPGWGGIAGSERQFTDGTSAIADDEYLRVAIVNPNAQVVAGYAPAMPAMPLSDAEVTALVEYIVSLK
ncbi:c-type cytochrome [Ferrimonas senticii]|uniref:c-type cytochrome n=1 Tax=Ferrimonas senticii TaxID=394566 RepID=UPI00040149EE|nr:cytochrome c [Ferrimonas senticii]